MSDTDERPQTAASDPVQDAEATEEVGATAVSVEVLEPAAAETEAAKGPVENGSGDRSDSADGGDRGDDETEDDPESAATGTRSKRKGSSETLESEAEIAADYLEELLDIADLDGDIDTYIEGDRAHVSIVSESDMLVGPNGAVLDALQELARLAVMTETGERSRLMLDVAGFRDKRRTELVSLASDAVAEVKSSQERVPLAPMNPFERKIVHDTVAAAGLTSESEGEEPKRHVVVLPVG